MKVKIPPIKSQGIKTKLVPWIRDIMPKKANGTWIEPFTGTSVVGFNLAHTKAFMCDINPHLINFYKDVQNNIITPLCARQYLTAEGEKLLRYGDKYYYEVRDRFNREGSSLDFLFLNRAGFNGMIRFNQKGKFNIPFCRRPNRFAQAYVTKIVNQIDYVSRTLKEKDVSFKCQSFKETLLSGESGDIIYCDPPYIDRHADYYNSWTDEHEYCLFEMLSSTKNRFILSTWHHNRFRKNKYIDLLWKKFNVHTRKHFYHVGGKESNRHSMTEAIVTNY